MSRVGTLTVWLLLLGGLCTVFAEDWELCLYNSADCTGDAECTDGDNDECTSLDVDNFPVDLFSADFRCGDGIVDGNIYQGSECDSSQSSSPFNNATSPSITCQTFGAFSFILNCDDSVCFSTESSVKMQDGSMKRVKEIQSGDMVESYNIYGRQMFSEVFLVQHKDSEKRKLLRRISYATEDGSTSGHITLSSAHLVRGSATTDHFLAASKLSRGSPIFVRVGDEVVKARVTDVKRVLSTYRNIHTMNDRIVVDGVLASSMTDLGPYWMLRAALLPVKALYRGGLSGLVDHFDVALHKLAVFTREKKLLKF
eukprot:Plantae.Rhodophyta-Purpureofilum_apyrenoidigerum.ctg14928.p1 GENE.Plantae.Rhodophyta-Purpureofilum_apyrenoidigerum.ctg14928~~Plantae.Rhodophyta-Purpureofilum_apyrenoidigerum.ctg14928.p1  ORF type:complete len:312 (+),score=39.92 Plantae.Rhodophyta-Purpureofilum_apyrenoidigerum.ctg14928:134-1069(+)